MKWITALVLGFFVIYSSLATFEWYSEKEKVESVVGYAVSLSDVPLWELANMGSVIEYLLENDTSSDVLRERVYQYSIHARTLSYSSTILYVSTKDEKYWLFGIAMDNLESFFVRVGKKPDCKEVLRENLDVLKRMGEDLKRKKRITDLTKEDAKKILDLSSQLRILDET